MAREPDRANGLPAAPRNFRMVIEYDGEAYAGWERQKNGLGIQEVIEDTLFRITGERCTLNGSGRTDAGVHAEGQVASFILENPMAVDELHRALNALLPADIAVRELEVVDLFFHARFDAVSKTYRYTVLEGRVGSPLMRRRVYRVFADMDTDAMARAAAHFVGRHDFRGFCKEAARQGDTVREIHHFKIRRSGRLIRMDVSGGGFLYNMVRILAGTLVYVGLGKIAADDIPEILISGTRESAGPTLPPHALTLLEVSYGERLGSGGVRPSEGGPLPP